MKETIHLKDVDLVQGNNVILESVNLTIVRGQLVVLSGDSGSGKTTLLQYIYNSKFENKSSIVFQNHNSNLLPYLTAKQNCTLPHMICGQFSKNIEDRVQNFFEVLRIMDVINKPSHQLSHGELKRVLLVRTLSLMKDIVILDEPTSGLDESNRKIMIDLLQEWTTTNNTIVMMSSHHKDDFIGGDHYFISNRKLIC